MPGAWSGFAQAIVKGVRAAGAGLHYVYRKGDEHKHYVLPAVNGLVGDKLAEANHPRAIQMSFRVDGRDCSVDDPAIASKIDKSKTVVIFVHGLMADEVLWQEPTAGKSGFGPRLDEDGRFCCFYVRYNSGRHISTNGRELAGLLEEFVKCHGKKVKRLVIIAHSMGGLVSRSAGYYGTRAKHKWISLLTNVVLVGVPNDGSYLEKFGHLATFVLKRIWTIPTKIIGRIADERSDGIKDLRWGLLVDEDWQHADADNLIAVHRSSVPPLPGVKYCIVAGTLLKEDAPVSLYFGDGLVGRASATGEVFRQADSSEEFLEFRIYPGFGHIRLITADEVFQYLIARIA